LKLQRSDITVQQVGFLNSWVQFWTPKPIIVQANAGTAPYIQFASFVSMQITKSTHVKERFVTNIIHKLRIHTDIQKDRKTYAAKTDN